MGQDGVCALIAHFHCAENAYGLAVTSLGVDEIHPVDSERRLRVAYKNAGRFPRAHRVGGNRVPIIAVTLKWAVNDHHIVLGLACESGSIFRAEDVVRRGYDRGQILVLCVPECLKRQKFRHPSTVTDGEGAGKT